jgi:hypothetical protein
MRLVIIGVVTALLLLGLGGAAYASYAGVGLVASGAPWVRVGSIGGPNIFGGGSGSGK